MTDFDAFYSAFQDRFRGPYDEVRQRFEDYLPEIEKAGAGSPSAPVLDLGCGRGEWLDLLAERKLKAEGVDSHPRPSTEARNRGVVIHAGDALDYLRNADDDMYGAITAFHLVEHLDWKSQLELLEQAHRVLRPKGIIVIEWPNIEDIRVAMQLFWHDPTHLRPLTQSLLSFMAEFAGFGKIRLRRFRPNPGLPTLPPNVPPGRPIQELVAQSNRTWNEFLTPGMDIALIAEKIAAPRARHSA